ncbi:MAG TPA: dihydroorotase [Cyclobacteriaceae bacterium]
MKILIQGAEIIDSNSQHHKKEKNVLIHDGRIASIGDKNFSADKVIKAAGMKLSAGWFDLGTFVGDPGMEYKEDLESAAEAAAAGGFTGMAMLPNTQPAVQTKNEISYITRGNAGRLVGIYPMAAVTKNCKGEELTEMIDLHEAGAIAFTDGLKPLWHTDILLKSLQYLQKFDGLLIDLPEDIWLNMFGQMHEGIQSTMLGLKGMPRVAEEIVVSKNLEILGYAGGRLHLSKLSTAKSVDLVRSAKKKMKITCNIASYQPLLDDKCVAGFETSYKVNPPLREKADQDALIKGIRDGTIDVICSGHVPQDEESKKMEFDQAEFGMINLQTFAANLVALMRWVDYTTLIEKVTANPRRLLNLEVPGIETDAVANLTLLDPGMEWILDDSTNRSRSKNSPWWGKKITGKAVAVFNNSRFWTDQ